MPIWLWECKLLKKRSPVFWGDNFRWSGLQQPGSRLFASIKEKRFLLRSPLKKTEASYRKPGCEAYTPLWTKVATADQVKAMLPLLTDTAKFFYIHSLPHSGSRPSEVQSARLLAWSYLVGPDLLRYPRPAQLWI